MHYGTDVSSNNVHPIAWPALFAHLKNLGGDTPFAIVKISQGTGYVNPDAAKDIAAARAAGFIVGGYLMDQGNDAPAAEEATFKAHSQGVPQFDDDELAERLSTSAYIAHLQSLVAVADVPQYLNQSEENEGFPAGAGIWEANYNNQPGVTHRQGVLIHQYTSSGSVPGAQGVFDLNCWTGSEAQFNEFFGLKPPAPPLKEEDMPLYATNSAGTGFVIATDLSSKTGMPDGADAAALLETNQYITVKLTDQLINDIPNA